MSTHPHAAAMADVSGAYDALLAARAKARECAARLAEANAAVTSAEMCHDAAIRIVLRLLVSEPRS